MQLVLERAFIDKLLNFDSLIQLSFHTSVLIYTYKCVFNLNVPILSQIVPGGCTLVLLSVILLAILDFDLKRSYTAALRAGAARTRQHQ